MVSHTKVFLWRDVHYYTLTTCICLTIIFFFYIPPLSSVHCIIFPLSFFHFFFSPSINTISNYLYIFRWSPFCCNTMLHVALKKETHLVGLTTNIWQLIITWIGFLIIWMAKTLLIQFIQSCMYVFKWSCIFLQIFLYYRA